MDFYFESRQDWCWSTFSIYHFTRILGLSRSFNQTTQRSSKCLVFFSISINFTQNIPSLLGLSDVHLPLCSHTEYLRLKTFGNYSEVVCENYGKANFFKFVLNEMLRYEKYLNILFLFVGYFIVSVASTILTEDKVKFGIIFLNLIIFWF